VLRNQVTNTHTRHTSPPFCRSMDGLIPHTPVVSHIFAPPTHTAQEGTPAAANANGRSRSFLPPNYLHTS
jgi:hypothetical protein